MICIIGTKYYILPTVESFTLLSTYKEVYKYIITHHVKIRNRMRMALMDAKILAKKYNVKIYYTEQYITPRIYCDPIH